MTRAQLSLINQAAKIVNYGDSGILTDSPVVRQLITIRRKVNFRMQWYFLLIRTGNGSVVTFRAHTRMRSDYLVDCEVISAGRDGLWTNYLFAALTKIGKWPL